MTNNTDAASLRMPAEWETVGAVMIAWPHEATDWAYMLQDVERCYVDLAHAIFRFTRLLVVAPDASRPRRMLADIPANRLTILEVPTNDTWTRDYGVITTIDAEGRTILNDFGFNAWGGKFAAEKDNAVTRAMFDAGLLTGIYADHNDFILEGGSIESDGCGTIMTTDSCLLTDTRNPEYAAIGGHAPYDRYLADTLGAKQVLWLGHGHLDGDDTDGHIDTIARLAPNNTIIYCGAGSLDDEQAESLKEMRRNIEKFRTLDGRPYRMVELPLPAPIYDEDGLRLPATYANYLVIDHAVLMPTYNQPANDKAAADALADVFKGREIVTVDCQALIRQHGSLHCATMQIPPSALPQ